MPAPTYPNVPVTQGVPPVPRDASNSASGDEPLLTRDADAIDRLAATQWGIFTQGGGNVLTPDNIAAVGYSAEYRHADYPLEGGGFESYNKVATPFSNRVMMTKGGRLSERQSFLATLESIRGDLNLYNVVTPERVYLNVNIERVTLDRNASNGATLLGVEVLMREIRQTATAAFSSSQSPSGADAVNNGSVQTKPSSQPVDQIK